MVDTIVWNAETHVNRGQAGKALNYHIKEFQRIMDRDEIHPIRVVKLQVEDVYISATAPVPRPIPEDSPDGVWKTKSHLIVEMGKGKTEQSFNDWFFSNDTKE